MSWTEERIEKLTRMWEGGATASQIADELGGVSRNAVIGKAHRLGLKARPSPVKPNDKAGDRAGDSAETSGAETSGADAASPPVEAAAPVEEPIAPPPPADVAEEEAVPVTAAPAAVDYLDEDEDNDGEIASDAAASGESAPAVAAPAAPQPRIVSVGPGGFLRQGPGDQQAPIPPAPPRRLVPAKPSPQIADKTSLLDLNERICRWPMGHPGEADFHFCGEKVNPGFPYCVEHCGRAYQAQLPRGSRRPPPPLPFGGPRLR